jgi:uncharacterized OB-fold protein/acyl dehydratase
MLVGEENGGWRLITTQLNNERVMLGPAGRFAAIYDRIHAWASKPGGNGVTPIDHADVKRSLGEIHAIWRINELLNWQVAAEGAEVSAIDDIQAAAERVKAEGKSKPRVGRHPVNQPMVDHWLDAMGDTNPIYVDEEAAKAAGHPGIVAPPAMIQVWTMMGLGGVRAPDDPLTKILELFDDAGYIGVVATNCEQTYHRYLRPGEDVSVSAELTDVAGPKRTALGEGFFITQKITWQVGDEDVAEMMWRIMKFKPAEADAGTRVPDDLDPDSMMRPASSRDTKFFWDGVNAHELRIQKRPDGSLVHPPVPALWQDKGAPIDYVVASGKGTVFSYVVHHAPKVPGRTLPFVIALVELEEGVRMLGELRNVDPATVEIGMPVRAMYIDFPEGDSGPAWTLYAWEPDA